MAALKLEIVRSIPYRIPSSMLTMDLLGLSRPGCIPGFYSDVAFSGNSHKIKGIRVHSFMNCDEISRYI